MVVTTRTIQGQSIYLLEKEVKESGGCKTDVKLGYFMQMMENWKEGEKKDSLSADELNDLKQKYHSDTMTQKDCVDLMEELVEAGIMTKEEARLVYSGGIPLDITKKNGFLQKCTPEFEAIQSRWNEAKRSGSDGNDTQKMGYDYFEAWYDWAKQNTNVDDPDNESCFIDTRKYMEILKELRS